MKTRFIIVLTILMAVTVSTADQFTPDFADMDEMAEAQKSSFSKKELKSVNAILAKAYRFQKVLIVNHPCEQLNPKSLPKNLEECRIELTKQLVEHRYEEKMMSSDAFRMYLNVFGLEAGDKLIEFKELSLEYGSDMVFMIKNTLAKINNDQILSDVTKTNKSIDESFERTLEYTSQIDFNQVIDLSIGRNK
ncbi:hypothetical protein OAQ84_00950 [Bdellovibrionales bacterium]|nr:hypothetical protein [Bdellovibrionales bacterium]